MSDRIKIIRLKSNPASAKARRRRRAQRRPPAASVKARASKAARLRRAWAQRGWVVEVLLENKTGVHKYEYRYFDGRRLVRESKRAKRYASEKAAHAAATQNMNRWPKNYVLARFIQA